MQHSPNSQHDNLLDIPQAQREVRVLDSAQVPMPEAKDEEATTTIPHEVSAGGAPHSP